MKTLPGQKSTGPCFYIWCALLLMDRDRSLSPWAQVISGIRVGGISGASSQGTAMLAGTLRHLISPELDGAEASQDPIGEDDWLGALRAMVAMKRMAC
jgi:hypothetical protein